MVCPRGKLRGGLRSTGETRSSGVSAPAPVGWQSCRGSSRILWRCCCGARRFSRAADGSGTLAVAIVAMIVINALAFFHEAQAERATEALREFLPPHVRVRRDGQLTDVGDDSTRAE